MEDENVGSGFGIGWRSKGSFNLHPSSYIPDDTALPITIRWISLVPS